jgi:N-hydroxyarylamine O-acetyltransferase
LDSGLNHSTRNEVNLRAGARFFNLRKGKKIGSGRLVLFICNFKPLNQTPNMANFHFDANAYLKRIGLTAAPPVNEEGLTQLHKAQFFSIPFENFDIQLGKEISLDRADIFNKLVLKKRGGYCFELNGLMDMALEHFGFKSRPLLARVHLTPVPGSRSHLLNLVEFRHASWIIDAGFGAGGLRGPVPLENRTFHFEGGYSYQLEECHPWGWMMRTLDKGTWKDSYSFDMEYVSDADRAMGNFFTSHSPDTHFTQIRTTSRPTENGRISLSNFIFTEIVDGAVLTKEIEDSPKYLDFLANRFGIELNVEYKMLRKVGK